MAGYSELKNAIRSVVKYNGIQSISGDALQSVLLNIVSIIGEGSTFAGLAYTNTNPGKPDQNWFYIASQPGTYSNFGGAELTDEILIFTNKGGTWNTIRTGIKLLDIQQSTGDSKTAVMSQYAVTQALQSTGEAPSYTNYLTCSTASGTANKTVNILGFSANNKVRLLIKMTYATTVDANLAISAPITVTKPLYYNGQRAGASNTWKSGAVLDIYYDGTNFQATDFISQGGGKEGISDVSDTDLYTFGYERQKGAWVRRSYFTDTNIGLIQSESDTDKLQSALGDFNSFLEAVNSGVVIYASEYRPNESEGTTYKVNVPISYKYDPDAILKTMNLSWTIDNTLIAITIDVSDGWGDIQSFKKIDLTQESYTVHISKCQNIHSHNNILVPSDNTLEVSLDRPLSEGYKLVMMRRKRVYRLSAYRDRKNGYGYRLVNGIAGYMDSEAYRRRAAFLSKLLFKYDSGSDTYILRNIKDSIITPFEFAKHYTEVLKSGSGVRISTAGSSAKILANTSEKNDALKPYAKKIKIQFGVAVIKFKNPESEDGGYIVCSNIAKLEFIFRNYNDKIGIDNLHTDEGLYKGFRVRVIN